MPGQFRPGGLMMRDCLKNRAGFDRVLMAVAATFLTVSATSALPRPIRPARAPPNWRSMPRSRVRNPPTSRRRRSTISSWTAAPEAAATTPHAATTRHNRRSRRGEEKPPKPKPSDIVAAPADERPAPRTRTPRPPPRLRQRRRPSLPNRSRPPAMSRRRISRSPTSCARCWAANRCAISTARRNVQRSRNSIPRATSRRCGRKAAR